jgi:hypothetical protein
VHKGTVSTIVLLELYARTIAFCISFTLRLALRLRQLVMLREDMEAFYHAVLESDVRTVNATYVMNVLECVYPHRIRELLGEQLAADDLGTVKRTAKKTKYVHLVCRAAIPIAEGAIWKAMEDEWPPDPVQSQA